MVSLLILKSDGGSTADSQRVAVPWNELPQHIVECDLVDSFKFQNELRRMVWKSILLIKTLSVTTYYQAIIINKFDTSTD